MPTYRAFISVPLEADDDLSALSQAYDHASSIAEDGVIYGHCEMVAEVTPGGLKPVRVVDIDPGFWSQVPTVRLFSHD